MSDEIGTPQDGLRTKSPLRMVSLVVVCVALVVYKIFWPWTPFWIDLVVIAIGGVVFLVTKQVGSDAIQGKGSDESNL